MENEIMEYPENMVTPLDLANALKQHGFKLYRTGRTSADYGYHYDVWERFMNHATHPWIDVDYRVEAYVRDSGVMWTKVILPTGNAEAFLDIMAVLWGEEKKEDAPNL